MERTWMLCTLSCGLALAGAVRGGEAREDGPEAGLAAADGQPPGPEACCSQHKPSWFSPIMFGDQLGLLTRPAGGLPSWRGGYKLAENESVRPGSRAYLHYSFYDEVLGNAEEVHRTLIGLECAGPGRRASFGVRVPFFFVDREFELDQFEETALGDLTFIFKFAVINEPDSVLSLGLALTSPTGPDPYFVTPTLDDVHETLLQPFVGYLQCLDRFYVHGFLSLLVPTHEDDVTVLYSDIGIGWRIERGPGCCITAILPTVELHLNTPLNQRQHDDLVRFQDVLDVTAGCYLVVNDRTWLGAALVTPLTGPRPFDIELIASFNRRF
jgi:hypothetical protein